MSVARLAASCAAAACASTTAARLAEIPSGCPMHADRQRMFWNSLVRKGKVGGASEGDMDTVIAVHNSMNEATPKAWLKQLFGHPKPFDRHDWIVVRGDGAEVRYVIDYYCDEAATARDETPKTMHDVGAVKSILLDVRPALDSPAALWDRVATMPLKRLRGELEPALPFFPSAGMGAPPVDDVQQLNAELVQVANDKIAKKCADNFQRLAACGDDEALRRTRPSASTRRAAAAEDPDKMEAAYEAMDRALDAFQRRAARGRRRAEEHAAERSPDERA
ncbi:holocytochrome-c synthase [Aureococcus anophagefferens]|nr:holocytochrome-c synthase [Aureococcus anophagefferens]